ncbi:hydrogenase [Nocardioides agariphilus]|jgi:hydrogenase-4 component F|uniref:Hydrogenase n=1 Tax=Nocardioides agariphilus TaxID=433664 RepID=A0A930YKN8_9ACTN|nr:proton-conducting transporter membrane subunit [Nocardioides agariphilus]MBF4766244.1 hydrogenase [Nocardioides agariphilus]
MAIPVTVRRYAGVVAAAAILCAGVALDVVVRQSGPVTALGGQLRADALSAFMLTVVGAVGLTATWSGLRVRPNPAPTNAYAVLVVLFLGAMSLGVLADNLGVLWVAVEATTIATAFLVGHHGTRRALEAAWKYVVLGSVGVAIAFLGIVLLYAATRSAGSPTLSWATLDATHPALDPSLVRLAAALTILGFATKAGLAPMHSWLPDAHSQAPAPVSGLMSGVLLSVAFYAILRVQAVAAPVIGTGLMRGMLATAGLLSLAVATLLLIAQRDLKRLLAYSSVEHMGVLALAAAIGGPLAISAALLHVLGHGLAKSSAFVASGWILETEGTTRIEDLRLLLRRRPGVAVPFLVGVTALLGLPPFSLFFSEVAIVVAGVQRGMGWVMAATVLLVLGAFAALARRVAVIAFGSSADEPEQMSDSAPDWSTPGPRFPLGVALGTTAVAGFVAGPFAAVLTDAARVLGGAG